MLRSTDAHQHVWATLPTSALGVALHLVGSAVAILSHGNKPKQTVRAWRYRHGEFYFTPVGLKQFESMHGMVLLFLRYRIFAQAIVFVKSSQCYFFGWADESWTIRDCWSPVKQPMPMDQLGWRQFSPWNDIPPSIGNQCYVFHLIRFARLAGQTSAPRLHS